ncbi:MAG: hypothetical protein IKT40_03665 [Bacilli bacterium]|nr:hypothetical protein [Bacilli bacterium]
METLIYDLSAINSKEGATYGFSLSSNVLTPGNKGVHNSFAYAKLTFNMPEKGTLELVVSQSSEKNFDFGLISNLDTELVKDYNDLTTNVLYSAKGLDGSHTITFEDVPKGEHFITIKYRKDTSQNTGSDTFNIVSLTATYEIPIVIIPLDINIKNPLTIFTSSLKTEGVNLIVEAEEVEVIEEEKEEESLTFTIHDPVGTAYTFPLTTGDGITFYNLNGLYDVTNTVYISVFNSTAYVYLTLANNAQYLVIASIGNAPVPGTATVYPNSIYYTMAGGSN